MKQLLIPATPTTYTLELTSRCNSVCVGCGNVFSRDFGDMDVAGWLHILRQLQPYMSSIRVTGGEPTLHPQFLEIIQLIDSLNVPFVLFSNGLWSKRDVIIKLLQECANLDGLLISLHGANSESHRAFTGVDSWEKANETIRLTTSVGINVNTNTVLTRANFQDILAISALSEQLGARFAAFSRYYGHATPITNLTESEFREAAAMIHGLRQQGHRVQFNNCVPSCFDGKPTKSCPAGITSCTIDPLGSVRPCTHAPHTLGNLFTHSIAEIWHGQTTALWRDLTPPDCKKCAEFTRCRGGCKAMAFYMQQAQDPLMRKPLDNHLPVTQPTSVTLYENARPTQNFSLREEQFGYLLVNRNQIIPVIAEAKPLLDSLDGHTTLRQIFDEYGQPGLKLVAYLFGKGLVHLFQETISR